MRVVKTNNRMPDFLFEHKHTGIKYKKFDDYGDMMAWCRGHKPTTSQPRGILVGRNQFRRDYQDYINVAEYEIDWDDNDATELTKYKTIYVASFGLEYQLSGKKYKKVIECRSVESKEDAIDRLYYGLAAIPVDNLIVMMHNYAGEELPEWDILSSMKIDMEDYPFDLVIADGEPNRKWFGGEWIELGENTGDFLFLIMPAMPLDELLKTKKEDWAYINDLIARSKK